MVDAPIVFLTGLHRSGTSPLYRLLSSHPEISGFAGTGVPEDEGQHLQGVVPPAKAYGGPGRFAFDPASYLDESSPLATAGNALAIWDAWRPWWDTQKPVLLEKSPPTLVRLRFFRALFPKSRAVVLVRHPMAVAKATQKWSGTTLAELILHWCVAHERFLADRSHLDRQVHVVRYEDCVRDTAQVIKEVLSFLGAAEMDCADALADHNVHYRLSPAEMEQVPAEAISARFGHVLRALGYELTPDLISSV